MMLGRRPEVPEYRLSISGQEGISADLIAHPLTDLGGGYIAYVVDVEAEKRT